MVQVVPNGPLLDYKQAFREPHDLESHRQSKREPPIALWCDAHAEPVEGDFFPTVGLYQEANSSAEESTCGTPHEQPNRCTGCDVATILGKTAR